ncbi:unnamed protein product [Durusdinium trenchii]|uniref:Uncharacterized protein n=1 Tax=Durusdinium trenchii TaxID=1381693 RepID=A0ABP0NXY1_9DINO
MATPCARSLKPARARCSCGSGAEVGSFRVRWKPQSEMEAAGRVPRGVGVSHEVSDPPMPKSKSSLCLIKWTFGLYLRVEFGVLGATHKVNSGSVSSFGCKNLMLI